MTIFVFFQWICLISLSFVFIEEQGDYPKTPDNPNKNSDRFFLNMEKKIQYRPGRFDTLLYFEDIERLR